MTVARGRRPLKFTSIDGTTTVYTFGIASFESQTSQSLRRASVVAAGAHYALDLLGTAPGLKANAIVRVRYVVEGVYTALDSAVDEAKSELQEIGSGKLWSADANGDNLRWRYARLTAMPDVVVNVGQLGFQPLIAEFECSSDEFDDTLTEEGEAINADPDTIVVTNAGNASVRNAIITIRGTFTNPSVSNVTSGYAFSSTRDGSAAAHWLKIDCGKGTVEFSTDSGATYADDMTLFTRGNNQVGFMKLSPGDNTFEITGCNGATIDVDFYPPFN